MRHSLLLSVLLLFAACGQNEQSAASDSSAARSLSAKDSFKQTLSEDLPPSSDISQFNWIYSGFAKAATRAEVSNFNVFINKEHGLWIIWSNGAMPSFTHVSSIDEFKFPNGKGILPIDEKTMMVVPKEEALPVADCNQPNGYSKPGCFTQMTNSFKEEKIWKYASLTPEQDKAVAQLATTITRTVVNTGNYKYYFSLIGGSWYLTFIDVRRPCEA